MGGELGVGETGRKSQLFASGNDESILTFKQALANNASGIVTRFAVLYARLFDELITNLKECFNY